MPKSLFPKSDLLTSVFCFFKIHEKSGFVLLGGAEGSFYPIKLSVMLECHAAAEFSVLFQGRKRFSSFSSNALERE